MGRKMKALRCAIYTRKSSEEGLEQEFNSLDAQAESCLAYIQSQKHEGWVAIKETYDDGGCSGGSMDRPAFQRLLDDIGKDQIDVVVVYKVDRLTRSLMDFARIVEIFDGRQVSFVSVTQQFNTSTSMGRLTLNVLLSFAQFEREVTGERIRDKLAASARKGLWTGGRVPIGYDVVDKKLIVNEREAETVRLIYGKFIELRSVRRLRHWLTANGCSSKVRISKKGMRSGGQPFGKGALYRILKNPVYLGEKEHKGNRYPGQHDAIIAPERYKEVQETLQANRIDRRNGLTAREPSLLAGVLFDEKNNRFTPAHANKGKRRYRYYVNQALHKGDKDKAGTVHRLPAREIEALVTNHLLDQSEKPDVLLQHLGRTAQGDRWKEIIQRKGHLLKQRWERSTPLEQRVCMQQIVTRVVVQENSVEITWGLAGLVRWLGLKESDFPAENVEITFEVPARFTRVGGETRTLIDGEVMNTPANRKDQLMIAALVKAHSWRKAFLADPSLTIRTMAVQARLTERYVTRLARLAYLAPDITEAILAGMQPRSLSLKTILKEIPHSWAEQRKKFGFA